MILSDFIQTCLHVPFNNVYQLPIPSQYQTNIRIIYEDKSIYDGTIGDLIVHNLGMIKDYFDKEIASWSVPTEDVEIDESKVLNERWMPVPSILEVTIVDSDTKESTELMSPLFNMRRAMGLSGIPKPRIVLLDIVNLVSEPSMNYVTIMVDGYDEYHGTVSDLMELMVQDNGDDLSLYVTVRSMYVSATYIPVMRNDDLFDPNKKYYPGLTIVVDIFLSKNKNRR